ncbi:MAG: right-handed parallel beta-helix repeat-containing protein [Phycisphaerales bacterium]
MAASRTDRWVYLTVLATSLATAGAAYGGGVLFVDRGACVGGDGLSWDTAFIELQSALDVVAEDDTVTAIKVAEGIYKPSARTDPDDPRTATFLLPDGVVLRGGFAGFGAPDPDERDIDLYETVLTGDLIAAVPNHDCCVIHDAPGCDCEDCAAEVCEFFPDCCEVAWDELCVAVAEDLCGDLCGDADLLILSYHVVCAFGVDETTVLDGFKITGGKANGSCCVNDRGGGMYLSLASPTVIDCNFIGNIASNVAGAVWLFHSAPTFIGCEFKSNFLSGGDGNSGAAIQNVFGSDLTLIDCVFQDNTLGTSSTGGGAILVGDGDEASTVVAQSCIFVGNNGSSGGAILNGGFADFSNCLFVGNLALGLGNVTGTGGAISNCGILTISNSTFVANSAIETGGAIYAFELSCNLEPDSVVTVDNCILWGNTGAGTTEQQQIGVGGSDVFVNYSCVEGLTGDLGGTGNIGADPLFVDPDGKDDIPGTEDDDLHLLSGSACIDAADNTAVPKGIDTDLDGNPRFVDDPATKDTGNGDPPIVDMGAYEFQVVSPCPWDLDGTGAVGASDLLSLLVSWGPCKGCPADFDGDGNVGASDLLALLANGGPCL